MRLRMTTLLARRDVRRSSICAAVASRVTLLRAMRTGASALALDFAECCLHRSSARGAATAPYSIDARTLKTGATGVARRLRLAAPVRVASEAVRGWGTSSLQSGSAAHACLAQ